MSDVPAGSMSLEQEEGTSLVGAVTDPEVTAAEPNAEGEPEPEGTISTPAGKVVPLSALQHERGLRKEAQGKLTAHDAEVAELRTKAQKYDEVAPVIQQAMPIIEGIKRRPDLVAQLNQPMPAAKEPAGPLTAEEAVDYAKDFDLYKPDGTPDIDRAQRIAKRHADMSSRTTQQAIAPFQQNEAQRQAIANFNHYAAMKDAHGNVVDRQTLINVWNNVPPEQAAVPAVANVLYLMALGQQVSQGKGPKAPMAPVLTTESPGGRPGGPAITTVDQSIMKAAGIAPKAYEETSARFKPGQANSLE